MASTQKESAAWTPTPNLARRPLDSKILSIWKLFFKSFEWLEEGSRNGIPLLGFPPPTIVGNALYDIFNDSDASKRDGHIVLLFQGVPNPALFKRCLQSHVMHTHGSLRCFDYGFESHNITLNADCAFSGTIVNSVYTRWPEKLSVASTQGRQSAYLVWGEESLKQTQAVYGLGNNLESDESVSRICRMTLQYHGRNIVCGFGCEPSHLFEYDESRNCCKKAENYDKYYKRYREEIDGRKISTSQDCEACIMKGDGAK